MKKILLGLLIMGLANPIFSQKPEQLSEVTVYATNYKYLTNVSSEEVASIPVKELEEMVANYDLKSSDFYQDEYDEYVISFYIPEGKILAAYDKDGKLLRTAEKFENVNLPRVVKESIALRFPGWTVTKDMYLVTYFDKSGAEKKYKLKLANGNKTIRVKMNEKGEYL
ncbi:nicotinate-nucleotide adenylyltransferase [Christiangramia crocea]|uniref:Nicotinate-nucleotide adenylyltransferase n=1 Tax=Christiangramia crocea TaxID=2904124 RepID=A0A9X2A799_9FLAO|nr:nicotinate-nucleotide adenylyltransferase [Gramella crocea]MCG9971671.1 nicotinate-nucleotide adenylyltransferase [Gramella crocea]